MKRIICVLVILSLLSLFGCSAGSYKNPVSFYYPSAEYFHRTPSAVIAPQTRYADDSTDISAILSLYLQGPTDPDLVSAFPQGTVLISAVQEGQVLHVTLSDSAGTLTGIDLTLACVSLGKTCLELTDAQTVQIRAETVQLDGDAVITVSADGLILTDESHAPETETDK